MGASSGPPRTPLEAANARDRSASIRLNAGPRATEADLLDLVRAARDAARADISLLARPLRIVVPSRSLRLHVCERIATELGSTAGVAVQTLHAVAIEILERTDRTAGGGDALVEILVRRAARRERALREACDPFRDGYRPVVSSVRDLLDAGLEPELVEPMAERLAETLGADPDLRRAQALVRVAGAVAGELVSRGDVGRPFLLARAREALLENAELALPSRGLIVHGFADLTGRAADLVEALVDRLAGRVLIDLPPDPSAPELEDRGAAFCERLVERLTGVAGTPLRVEPPSALASTPALAPVLAKGPPTEGQCFRAPGASAEVREVARRLREALADGARPERCGVVARDMQPYRAALRTHFGRLGIPFSGLRIGAPVDGPGRRLAALLELLEHGAATGVDRWLDALARYPLDPQQAAAQAAGRPGDGAGDGDRAAGRSWTRPSEALRLGLRMRGGLTLELVPTVELDPESPDALNLPIRRGVGRRPAGEGPHGPEAQGRFVAYYTKLKRTDLAAAQARATAALDRFERWNDTQRFSAHLAEFQWLRRKDLGWRDRDPAERRIGGALADLAEDLADEVLDREEFFRIVSGAVRSAAELPLGGDGGGVQVLEVMEARGRTFEHLFVLGMQRDSFPRPLREDPLFGDDLRGALAELLPEIPVKARGRDEERYLFAQLMAASERTTLSWQVADDDGRARVVSPLLVRVLGEGGDGAVPLVPGLHDPDASGPRTAHEAAVAGGLELRTKGYRERLGAALDEARLDPDLAGIRTRVVEAHAKAHREPEALAPWLGFLGDQDRAGIRPDPRVEPFFVTRLEGISRCPWQTVLTRFLRLERQPDPVEDLPTVEGRVVGNVVHKVLERIATEAGVPMGGTLGAALERDGWTMVWPVAERFEQLLEQESERELRKERAPEAGHVRLVAACARETLLQARQFLEREGARFEDGRVLGVESEGRAVVALEDGELAIDFKADRVERREGTVVLSDYKTGRPKDPRQFPSDLAAGLALQPAVYALAADASSGERSGSDPKPSARGRYLYFKADPEAVELGSAPGAHAEEFARAVSTLAEAWVAGTLFPRLVTSRDKEPDACRYCDVAPACLRGDSAARRAMGLLAAEESDQPPPLSKLFHLTPDDVKARAKAAKAAPKSGGAR